MEIIEFNEKILQSVYLLQKYTDEGWSKAQLESELQNKTAIGFCALIGETAVGYLSCHIVCDEATLNNIVVLPKYRGKGIAKKMLTYLVDYLLVQEVNRMFLEVRSKNKAAISLYEGFNFVQNGKRANFYTNPCDDALLYVKLLNN